MTDTKKEKKESKAKVLALKTLFKENGDKVAKGTETTLSKKELGIFKKAKAIKEL